MSENLTDLLRGPACQNTKSKFCVALAVFFAGVCAPASLLSQQEEANQKLAVAEVLDFGETVVVVQSRNQFLDHGAQHSSRYRTVFRKQFRT